MIFGPDLVIKILGDDKTVTRRRLTTGLCGSYIRYQVGKTYAVQPGRGKHHVGHIRVLEVTTEHLGDITDAGARAEGFTWRGPFMAYWERLHGTWDGTEPVAVIRFELAPRCDDCHF